MKLIIWDFLKTLYDPSTGTLNRGTLTVLGKLQNKYDMVLVSSASSGNNERKELIESLGLNKFFKEILIRSKSEELFKQICKRYNCQPEEVYVIGDNSKAEIAIGNDLGMKVICVDNMMNKEASCQNRINNLKEILEIIE